MFSCSALILKHKQLNQNHFLLTFYAPEMAAQAYPGQFVHVRCSDAWDPLLRRPLSLHKIEPEAGALSLLYRVVGRGTERLSRFQPGEYLEVMGPLGRGFQITGPEAIVVGGGIGVAPLLPLVQALIKQKIPTTVLLGASTQTDLLARAAFANTGAQIEIATDDGSLGIKGTVVDLLRPRLKAYLGSPVASTLNSGLCVYACGPQPMLSAIWQLCRADRIPLQLSLEERMGCGVGACLACVCRALLAAPYSEAQTENYLRVCVDGPVFWGKEVILDAP